jgi:hypothetical protein
MTALSEPHVLVTFASRDDAAHALAGFEVEGIPADLLRIERRAVAPVARPRRIAYWMSGGGAAIGAVAGVALSHDPTVTASLLGAYGALFGTSLGVANDFRRRRRFERRRRAAEARSYVVTCPARALVAQE